MNRKFSLKENHDIEKLVKLKKSVGNKYFCIYYQNNDVIKIAISISKKLGKAYFRNYQKRVLREIIRKNFDLFAGYKILIIIKHNSVDLNYQEKEIEIKNLMKKIRKNK